EGGVAHVAARSSELSGTRVHDKGLRHLCGLKKLCELNLSCAPVTDAAIDDIVALPALERIVLTFTGLTANGLAELRARRPKLDVRYWEQEDSDVTFDLVRAGLWAQALEKLESVKLDFYPCKIAWMFGECHAGLGQLDRAEADYIKALELVPTPDGTLVHITSNTTMVSS